MKRPSNAAALWRVSIRTAPDAEDAVTDLLQRVLNQPVSSYTDVETQVTSVNAYLTSRPSWAALRRTLKDGLTRIRGFDLDTGPADVRLRKLPPERWADSWKRHFAPIDIEGRLLVKPSWSRRKARRGQATLILDPGLSFGTGQHPTTSFCLRQLALNVRPGQSVLDIGTGSGVLAIAAALLGAGSVEAFDVDPDAVRIARDNATVNNVRRRIRFHRADLGRVRGGTWRACDIVCANLISTLLIAERETITCCVQPGGLLLLAGILNREFGQVRTAYVAAGFRLVKRSEEGGWCSGTFRRETNRTG